MSVITEYLRLQRKHELELGERTVVLMQIGTFYEIYSYDPTYCGSSEAKVDKTGVVWNEPIGHAVELSVILNSVLTHEDGNEPYSICNPHKVGFPLISYDKNLTTLLANDYVVLRYDQHKDERGKVTRFLARSESPTMQLDTITLTRPTSNIACIYIEYHQGLKGRYDNFTITTGAAVVDVITGQNRVCEFYSKAEDQIHAVQELYRFLISHYPRELLVHIGDMPPGLDTHTDAEPNAYVSYLERILELRRFDRLTVNVNKIPLDYKKIPYQVEFLNKLFTKQPTQATQGLRLNIIQKRNERIIEELGIERMNYGRIAYMLLMQHCYAHNAGIITRLAKPDLQWIDERKHLILTHNAIVQLDLIPSTDPNQRGRRKATIDSLMSVLDQNRTHLGRRVLHTLLQNPMLDPVEIRTYYDMVDEMSVSRETEPLWTIVDRQLKELPDIGRLQRKLEIKLISPKELAVLYGAYVKIINIYVTVMKTKSPVLQTQTLSPEDVSNFNAFMARFGTILDFAALECCHIDSSVESNTKWLEFGDCPIKPGHYQALDEKAKLLVAAETKLQTIVDHLNTFLTHTRGQKLEFKAAKKKQGAKKQDPTGTVLTTTAAKANTLSAAQVNTALCGAIQVLPYTASDRIITSPEIAALCTFIDETRMWMRQYLFTIYENILEEMVSKYTFYVGIANFIAKIDLIHSYAKVSSMYNYCRPDIIMEPSPTSYLEARELRHPIIERLIDGVYVTNDISLGQEPEQNNGKEQGALLFGINQTGKSSFAKAIALIIIMAQAGCFVPARLRYVPYAKIITRISGNDNIFKGQSSFALEMTELRTILRQADAHTLVIGDEIARGTETNSGMSIAAGTILSLIDSRTSFIFATHMHDLLELSFIKNIPRGKLRICHLEINYDEATGNLIYNRKLKDGSGSSVYGLLVAKHLGLPDNFIATAKRVLSELMGEQETLLNCAKSRYNAKLYIDSCAICGKTHAQTELQTHHIIEQNLANEKGIVQDIIKTKEGTKILAGTMHKNAKDNLIVLCKECHKTLHQKKGELEALNTGNGTIIRVKPYVQTTLATVPLMVNI